MAGNKKEEDNKDVSQTAEEIISANLIWMEDSFKKIDEVKAINNEVDSIRAKRGILIGDLGGDIVNVLLGAYTILHPNRRLFYKKDDFAIVQMSWDIAWQTTTKLLDRFGGVLRPDTRKYMDEIFQLHTPDMQLVKSATVDDPDILYGKTRAFFDDIHALKVAPGFCNDDICYGLHIVLDEYPKLHPKALPGKR